MENTIQTWQEAVCGMSDERFFATMRLYLGEIRTPYNKQRLTEQLASFLKNKNVTSNIITLLDSTDLQILTAISIIPQATQEKLIAFFNGTFSVTEMYAALINLSERLLIYKCPVRTHSAYPVRLSGTGTEADAVLLINPLLYDELKPHLSINLLFPHHTLCSHNMDDVFVISPDFLAAFFSYILQNGISCKNDGKIKKTDAAKLSEVFCGRENLIQALTNALVNLSLLRESDKNLRFNKAALRAFAALEAEKQYALLCAASVSRFGREGLRKEAQLLLDSLASVPQEGFSRSELLRLAFLQGTHSADGNAAVKKSRFSMMIQAARESEADDATQNTNLLDSMLDSAIEMGLLYALGTDEQGNFLYASGLENAAKSQCGSGSANPKVLNIDSIFSVTIMPGLSLEELLPITSFMSVKKSGIATEYEITRKSVSAAFDEGHTPQGIFELIEKYLPYEIPQNLKVNITEWHNSYSSAKLYRGYILKVNDTNISLVENNPLIKKAIKEKLAQGIYLLNLPVDASEAELSHFMNASGLEFLGAVSKGEQAAESFSFPLIAAGRAMHLEDERSASAPCKKVPDVAEGERFMNQLKQALAQKDLNKNQAESLEYRIKNRLIVSESQLTAAAVRTEILEADGIDFSGKVHLLETAAKEGDLTELQLPNPDGSAGFFVLMGVPLGVSRQTGEAVLRFQIQPTNQIETFLVSRISHVRRLRY